MRWSQETLSDGGASLSIDYYYLKQLRGESQVATVAWPASKERMHQGRTLRESTSPPNKPPSS
jgi:hypothetical protein